ncbi:hypothetical protein B296_00011215 [Ensete ventricosum]|uniref:BRWD/PHIP N-terminal domain-containing protein n=1 Tax=Ensete ventricosum TaxID=4639 RepID=A0A427B382_ENSVE|nr:hypothetical protein B296_00011215 [Ensete ventricosum]
MASRKYKSFGDETSVSIAPLNFSERVLEKVNPVNQKNTSTFPVEADVDIDIREVYFLIMHFLSSGPCKRTYGQLWNELLEHQLLPRRYHAWYSRCGARSGDEDDDGMSLPLCYIKLTESPVACWLSEWKPVRMDHHTRFQHHGYSNLKKMFHGTCRSTM